MQTMLANPNKSSSIKIDAKLRALHEKLFVQANPIPVKWARKQRRDEGDSTFLRRERTPSAEQHGARRELPER